MQPLKHPDKLFVDGRWISPSTTNSFLVENSATNEEVVKIAAASESDVNAAVAAARSAFDNGPWPYLRHEDRAEALRAIAAGIEMRAEEFSRSWTLESGVTYLISSSRLPKIMAGAFRFYADLASRFPFEEPHETAHGGHAMLVREPVGVVAAILPWNGPAGMAAYKCAPALLAGCTLILKAAPEAPISAYLLAEIVEEAGLPAGVLNVLAADRVASEALVRNPMVDKVTFTGSTAAGKRIAAICGERIARCTLELGGKSPAIVLDDCDLETAAKSIIGGSTYLSGQVCHSLTRIIVPRSKELEMTSLLEAQIARIKVGDPFDPTTDMGPLSTREHYSRVSGYVSVGVEDGATLVIGGVRPKGLDRGNFLSPTLFANVDPNMRIAREEIFGPVLCVIGADDEAAAVSIANDTPYGLNAAVFTESADRMRRIARQLRAGSVGHNGSKTDFGIAFGGYKQSGIGREGGVEGLLPFLEMKTVVSDLREAVSIL